MLIKTLAGIGLFAAGGAAIGYSKILCTGDCAITGTPYGGAFFGGMLGFAIMSGINTPSAIKPAEPAEPSESDYLDCDRPDEA